VARRVLLTFSGKHGDILWSLQAARAMALTGAEVDFAVMPAFVAVLPLIAIQPYVHKAFAINGWHLHHDGCGAQPRLPPSVPAGYDEVHHLTYDSFPTEPLILWSLKRLGLPMPEPAVPFLFAPAEADPSLVAYAFNASHRGAKENMLKLLQAVIPEARFENVETIPFDQAARRIKSSRFFFGCRSANYVLAMGLGKRCLIFEPDAGRRSPIFGCPVGDEHMPDPSFHHQFVDLAKQWMESPDAND